MPEYPRFLDIPAAAAAEADVLLLPLPFEATVSYGHGTGAAPEAIWRASGQVEDWDDELDFDLFAPKYHSAPPVTYGDEEPEDYLRRVREAARELHAHRGLVFGIGGEHSLTPALIQAAAAAGKISDLGRLTVVQIDAHADLRDEYDQTRFSHACAMRRVLDLGASVLAIGVRSADRAEARFGRECGRVETWYAQTLATDPACEPRLLERLGGLTGDVYLTVDIDALDPALAPGTGTPQPGGLGWYQTLRLLRRLLRENPAARLVGCDLCEVVPQEGTAVNEFVAARLVCKIIAYHLQARAR